MNSEEPDQTAIHLSPREREAVRLFADGLVRKEVAETMKISVTTVDSYIQRLFEKFNVNTIAGVVARAIREELI